jgi:hypothetical protein
MQQFISLFPQACGSRWLNAFLSSLNSLENLDMKEQVGMRQRRSFHKNQLGVISLLALQPSFTVEATPTRKVNHYGRYIVN